MAIERFVKAAGREYYVGANRIPGTNKIRTYVTGAWLYSRESDLEKITARQYRAAGAKKKIESK